MAQSKMLMEMQQPVQGMEETVPTVENQENYTAHTHFTSEEVKAAWQPDPEVSVDAFQSANAARVFSSSICSMHLILSNFWCHIEQHFL
jgi:uncharacterized protein YqiB (DUF1249 family)